MYCLSCEQVWTGTNRRVIERSSVATKEKHGDKRSTMPAHTHPDNWRKNTHRDALGFLFTLSPSCQLFITDRFCDLIPLAQRLWHIHTLPGRGFWKVEACSVIRVGQNQLFGPPTETWLRLKEHTLWMPHRHELNNTEFISSWGVLNCTCIKVNSSSRARSTPRYDFSYFSTVYICNIEYMSASTLKIVWIR